MKPAARLRTRIVTDDEFQSLLRKASNNPAFRRVLIAFGRPAAAPVKFASLTGKWSTWIRACGFFPTTRPSPASVVPGPASCHCPPSSGSFADRLATKRQAGSDRVFFNMQGKPYSKDCLVKIFTRLRRKSAIAMKAGERIVLYSHRHTFATECSGRIADIELAELLGHTTTQMIPRYTHFNVERLREIRSRADLPR